MTTKSKPRPAVRQTVLLDKAKKRSARFGSLHPQVVSSLGGLRDSLALATKDTLWISYDSDLTQAILKSVFGPPRSLGRALLIHSLDPRSVPALTSCFSRFASASNEEFLPPDELAEALDASNSADLFIGGSVDPASQTITLWRGTLEPLTVPFTAFEKSGDGTKPDFTQFAVTDSGQTIQLGDYEAAADAILYEFDPEYRKRINKEREQSEQSFGASLRRLRKQKGLRREDFAPDVAAKTIARIEQGLVQRVQRETLNSIAKRLGVKPEDIETF
jgi:DNA-binding Xre family transcriptional regulator